VLGDRAEKGRPYGNPSHPAGYPWQVAPQQSLLAFHRPMALLSSLRSLSSRYSSRCSAFRFACFSGGGEFGIALGQDRFGSAVELVLGRYVADRAVQTTGIVMVHEIGHNVYGVLKRQRSPHADAGALDRSVIAFQFSVALRVVRRGLDMRHPADTDELLEIFRYELRAIVGNNPWFGIRKFLPASLQNDFDIRFSPGAFQTSPGLFFSCTWEAMISASTSSLPTSLAFNWAFCRSNFLAWLSLCPLPVWLKAAVPFSKNTFCLR
jgi:hypothetical protein